MLLLAKKKISHLLQEIFLLEGSEILNVMSVAVLLDELPVEIEEN